MVSGVVLLALLAALPARAARDVVHFGSAIDVAKGETIHDAVCFFCSVRVKGAVRGDLVVFFGDVRIDGSADQDVVSFFGDVKAADGSSIGHDLVNIFGGVELGRSVTVGQDAVVLFGQMRAADSASVGGERVEEAGWIFWVPFLLIAGGVSFLVRQTRWMRRRRLLRGYRV
jgi:hypothetical protein